ncbi:unnamed protein product [Amoebophrya sp. A25]|nr:unnamed protein product [Amoebophrya sp. A25]|eukprot:GSA25T00007130001.1
MISKNKLIPPLCAYRVARHDLLKNEDPTTTVEDSTTPGGGCGYQRHRPPAALELDSGAGVGPLFSDEEAGAPRRQGGGAPSSLHRHHVQELAREGSAALLFLAPRETAAPSEDSGAQEGEQDEPDEAKMCLGTTDATAGLFSRDSSNGSAKSSRIKTST